MSSHNDSFAALSQRIRAVFEARIARLLGTDRNEFIELSSSAPLGELVNVLYTLSMPEDMGGFGVVFKFLERMIGREEIWRVPEDQAPAPESKPEPEKTVVN